MSDYPKIVRGRNVEAFRQTMIAALKFKLGRVLNALVYLLSFIYSSPKTLSPEH